MTAFFEGLFNLIFIFQNNDHEITLEIQSQAFEPLDWPKRDLALYRQVHFVLQLPKSVL